MSVRALAVPVFTGVLLRQGVRTRVQKEGTAIGYNATSTELQDSTLEIRNGDANGLCRKILKDMTSSVSYITDQP